MEFLFHRLFHYTLLMAYKGVTALTADNILSKVSEEQLIQYYLGYGVNYTKLFTNPLRGDDESPGCKFYISKTTGRIKFIDFAESWDEDIFGIVMRKFGYNFPRALEKIAKDFGLFGYDNNNGSNPVPIYANSSIRKIRERSKITIRTRGWNKVDADYWKSHYLDSKDLLEGGIRAVYLAWLDTGDGDRLIYEFKPNDPCYAYTFMDRSVKLYFPFRKEGRFLGNSKYIQGYNLLPPTGDYCIITKSYKDVLCMRRFGISAIAPQAESIIPSNEIIVSLRQRFTELYSLYDWDRAGIKSALKMRDEYGIPALFFTRGAKCNFLGAKVKIDFGIKDFAENLQKYGVLDTIDIISYFKDKILYQEDEEYVPF